MRNPEGLTSVWRRIDAWLTQHAPDIAADLNPPASPAAVAEIEAHIGRPLPNDVRATFQIHDGQRGSAPWSFFEWKLLPIRLVAQEFDLLHRLQSDGTFDRSVANAQGPVHAVWWSPGWIPLLDNGSGDYLCVDVDPPDRSRAGQLVHFLARDASRKVIASSLAAWLSAYADDLDAGRIGRDDHGSLIRT